MFPSALMDSQSMFISGVTMIFGFLLLRAYVSMRKSVQKPNLYEQARQRAVGESGKVEKWKSGREENHLPTFSPSHFSTPKSEGHTEALIELLTLSRQIKAEIDTKIVALQLMIADAERVLQEYRSYIPHGEKVSFDSQLTMQTRHSVEPERVRVPKQEETICATPPPQQNTGQSDNESGNPGDLKNIIVEDPFADSDFGFNKAMRELDHLSSNIPAFDAMQSLDSWGTPKAASPSNETTTRSSLPPMPEWDIPISYPISDYRNEQGYGEKVEKWESGKVSPPHLPTFTPSHPSPLTPHPSPKRHKKPYTNKLLTQPPPQLDALMAGEPVGKMGSKPQRTAGQNPNTPVANESLVPPVIPKVPPPNALAFLLEGTPFTPSETGLDKIAVRKAKRHQLEYLIDKGLSPKEIAAHLEMPVGEVELILSLHKRQSVVMAKTAKPAEQPLPAASKQPPKPPQRPRIIAAENVIVNANIAPSEYRFQVISAEDENEIDGEQVA